MHRGAKRGRHDVNASASAIPASVLRINGLPVVSLETLTPSILPKADFTASSNILSAALKQQRACIVDIGAELATVLSQALPDDEVLYNHVEGAIEHISKREKEILRFSASPDATEIFTMQALMAMDSIGRTCLAALAHAIGLRHDAFLHILDDIPAQKPSASMLDVVKYKPVIRGGCSAHEDQGLLTVIYSPRGGALQVQSAFGRWQSCVLQREHVLIIAGATLQHSTSGIYAAAQHQVDGARVIVERGRDSLAYKLRADADAVIDYRAALIDAGLPYSASLYPQPVVVRHLLDRFNATHSSVNAPAPATSGRAPAAPQAFHGAQQGTDFVMVKTFTGSHFSVHFGSGLEATSIDDLRQAIEDEKGIPVEQQRLIHAGKQLKDGGLLSYYGITNGSVVYVALRLKGD